MNISEITDNPDINDSNNLATANMENISDSPDLGDAIVNTAKDIVTWAVTPIVSPEMIQSNPVSSAIASTIPAIKMLTGIPRNIPVSLENFSNEGAQEVSAQTSPLAIAGNILMIPSLAMESKLSNVLSKVIPASSTTQGRLAKAVGTVGDEPLSQKLLTSEDIQLKPGVSAFTPSIKYKGKIYEAGPEDWNHGDISIKYNIPALEGEQGFTDESGRFYNRANAYKESERNKAYVSLMEFKRDKAFEAMMADKPRRAQKFTDMGIPDKDYTRQELLSIMNKRIKEIDAEYIPPTPEEQAAIVNKHTVVLPSLPKQQRPRADIILGPSASGKSNMADSIIKKYKSFLLDNDSWKKDVAGKHWHGGLGSNAAHPVSADVVGKEISKRALESGANIVKPMVGKSYESSVVSTIAELKKAGYDVHVHATMAPKAGNVARAEGRFYKSGNEQWVPSEYVSDIGNKPMGSMRSLISEIKTREELESVRSYGITKVKHDASGMKILRRSKNYEKFGR